MYTNLLLVLAYLLMLVVCFGMNFEAQESVVVQGWKFDAAYPRNS
jgi:hypothetical protein